VADAAAEVDGAETPTVVRRRAANEKPRRVDARRGASAPGQQARTSVATLALAAAVSLASRLRAAPCAPAGAEDQDDLATGEGELTTLFSRSLFPGTL
jgi:hypothetical protein